MKSLMHAAAWLVVPAPPVSLAAVTAAGVSGFETRNAVVIAAPPVDQVPASQHSRLKQFVETENPAGGER